MVAAAERHCARDMVTPNNSARTSDAVSSMTVHAGLMLVIIRAAVVEGALKN
jgi:hypothetical protein